MKVVYISRRPVKPSIWKPLKARRLPMSRLLKISDFLSLHVPLTSETRHLIGANEIAQMKKTAYFINTSRGAVVDEAALVAALKKGLIAGAGLDVYEAEPKVHRGLSQLKNVVLLPHLGSASYETRNKMGEMVMENILAVLQGRKAPAQVN